MLNHYLTTFRPKQLAVATHTQGPLLIIAGAGTGKTTTITAKIAHMVKKDNIPPEHILALTFSKEAARNMEHKVQELLGDNRDVKVSTFHSFCAEIIRDNPDKCNITDDFTIIEEIDSAIFLHKEAGIDIKNAAFYTNTISKAKDLNIPITKFKEYIATKKALLGSTTPKDQWDSTYHDFKVKLNTFHLKSKEDQKAQKADKNTWKDFITLYDEYQKYQNLVDAWEKYELKKADTNTLDYGDLNLLALEYLNTYGTGELNDTYRYIIVDEFQDTNHVQFELIKKLTAKEQNITVVADSNQTIYAFRGAYSDNIAEYKRQFGITDNEIITLDTSFRSTNSILGVSHRLIEKNYAPEQRADCIRLVNHENNKGNPVIIQEMEDEKEEARKVVEMIEAHIKDAKEAEDAKDTKNAKDVKNAKDDNPLSDIAVLYRTHAQGRLIKEALMMRGLPVSVKDDTDFLKQPEIKTAFSYLYVLNNLTHPTPRGTEAWWRLFHYNNALSSSDSVQIAEYVKKNWISFQDAIYHHMDELEPELSKSGIEIVNRVKELIEELSKLQNLNISDLVLEIYDRTGLSRQFSHLDTIRSREALLNLGKLHDVAVGFEKSHGRELSEFVDYLEILDEMGGNPAAARISEDDAIRLMTIHGSKGLEFEVVFVVNMAKDKFPLMRGGREPLIPLEFMEQFADIYEKEFETEPKRQAAISERKREIKLEEERRLAYVAFTRARNHLIITFASTYGGNPRDPSMFLIDVGLSELVDGGDGTNDQHGELVYYKDSEIKARELVPDDELEREKTRWRKLVMESLDSDNLSEAMHNVLVYRSLHDVGVDRVDSRVDYNYLSEISSNWSAIDPEADAKEILSTIESSGTGLKFNPDTMTFSVSSIKTYEQCPKQYELAQILRMPTRAAEDSTGAMMMGSFVHEVFEIAVKDKITTEDELNAISDKLIQKAKWKGVDIKKVRPLLDVFWLRNKDRIKNNLFVEKRFTVPLDGFIFKGFIDRVDLLPGSGNEVEIIDYKTGKSEPGAEERAKQLLLYKLGFNHLHPEYIVRRLSLDLLARDKPRVYELQNNGEYTGDRVKPLDMGVIDGMVETARQIAHDYEHGFGRVDDAGVCKDCGFRLYCDGGEGVVR